MLGQQERAHLDAIQTHVFNLDDVNSAVAKASELKGLDYCVLGVNQL